MFTVNSDLSIYLTRGDAIAIKISANLSEEEQYTFKIGDVVRFKVFEKNRCNNVVLTKVINVEQETTYVDVCLSSEDTKIGDLINKPKDYWYEVEVNPNTSPQTIIGYDVHGPKIFRLYPEGDDN